MSNQQSYFSYIALEVQEKIDRLNIFALKKIYENLTPDRKLPLVEIYTPLYIKNVKEDGFTYLNFQEKIIKHLFWGDVSDKMYFTLIDTIFRESFADINKCFHFIVFDINFPSHIMDYIYDKLRALHGNKNKFDSQILFELLEYEERPEVLDQFAKENSSYYGITIMLNSFTSPETLKFIIENDPYVVQDENKHKIKNLLNNIELFRTGGIARESLSKLIEEILFL